MREELNSLTVEGRSIARPQPAELGLSARTSNLFAIRIQYFSQKSGCIGSGRMRIIPSVFLVIFLAVRSAFAQDPSTSCLLYGPSYQLASDTVEWSMTIASGQSCVRGLRTAFVVLDDIKLVSPPQSGQVILEGPAFVYKGDSNFRGADSFSVLVSGKLNRLAGSSTIRISVSVR
jgi:hypothetical protein